MASESRSSPVALVKARPQPPKTYPGSVLHELWDDGEDGLTFCLAGPMGDNARALLPASARLMWTVESESHFEAMTVYYRHMGWRTYTTEYPELDKRTYAELGWE